MIQNDYSYGYSSLKKQISTEKRRKRANIKLMLYFILTLVLIGLIVIAYIGQSLYITHLNYQLLELKKDLNQLKEDNHHLNIQLAQKRSLARIEEIARTKLHMIEPEKVEIVVLNDREKEPETPLKNKDKVFFAKVIDDLLERIGTVKAGELN